MPNIRHGRGWAKVKRCVSKIKGPVRSKYAVCRAAIQKKKKT